jgi:hypothetical protein
VALALALGGAAAGTVVALGTARANDLAKADFPGFEISFSYPAAWHRKDWCWLRSSVYPLTLLTTAPPPRCVWNTQFGVGTPLPPAQLLGTDGVAAWWQATNRAPAPRPQPNARVDGQPARITVRREPTRRTAHSPVTCKSGPTQRLLSARIQAPTSSIKELQVGAVICGPAFAAGEADAREMLASLRFKR